MKRLRKILTGFLLFAAVLTVALWAFVAYKQKSSYQTPIHREAAMLVRVDVYEILKSMLPGYRGRDNKRTGNTLPEGIDVPANIFLYTLKNRQTTTWLVTLPVKSREALERSLAATGMTATGKKEGAAWFSSKDGLVKAGCNDRWLVLAFSAGREAVGDIMSDVLNGRNTVTVAESAFRQIKEERGHITFVSEQSRGRIQFGKSHIDLHAEVAGSFGTDDPVTVRSIPGAALHCWLNVDPGAALPGRSVHLGNITLSGDSLSACRLKRCELIIAGTVIQQDTVVSYEYNDDFEKEAVLRPQEKDVPRIYGYVDGDAAALQGYLERSAVLEAAGGRIHKNVFPLYTLRAMAVPEGMLISNGGDSLKIPPEQALTPAFCGLDVDVDKLLLQKDLALLRPYLEPYRSIHAEARKTGNSRNSIEAKIRLKNRNRHSLWQLLEAYVY